MDNIQLARIAAALWLEWDTEAEGVVMLYTNSHVEIDTPLTQDSLAIALLQYGVVNSLGESYSKLEEAKAVHSYTGLYDNELLECSEEGWTEQGEYVGPASPITVIGIRS